MKAYIQFKSQTDGKSWEEIPQDEMNATTEDKARIFAKSLAKHLNKNVRLVLNRKDGNGIYYSPKTV